MSEPGQRGAAPCDNDEEEAGAITLEVDDGTLGADSDFTEE